MKHTNDELKKINEDPDAYLEEMSTEEKWMLVRFTQKMAFTAGHKRGFWIGSLPTGVAIIALAWIMENWIR